MMPPYHEIASEILKIQASIRDTVVRATDVYQGQELRRIVADQAGDTIFLIDRIAEDVLVDLFGDLARRWPCVLVGEGLGETGSITLPCTASPNDAVLRIIVDPIDGTRCLMYQKRPGWILTGVAPNLGEATRLSDIEIACQTEIPLAKQHLSDVLWAIRGEGVRATRYNRLTGSLTALEAQPSQAPTIRHGFGELVRFFPGGRGELAAIDDLIVDHLFGSEGVGRPLVFEDQYPSTGGQLAELMMGHDRWVGDLRPLVRPTSACCHPYDLCTELVAREAGVIVTDPFGRPLNAPLDVTTDVAWVGYANRAIMAEVRPVLEAVLRSRKML